MVHQWGFFGSISAIRKIWSLSANSRSLQAAALKGRLLEHYKGQFKALSGTPVPTPRKKSRAISPQSTDEEPLFPSATGDVEQRIDKLELAVSRMRLYMDESLSQFRISLTESIKESTE